MRIIRHHGYAYNQSSREIPTPIAARLREKFQIRTPLLKHIMLI